MAQDSTVRVVEQEPVRDWDDDDTDDRYEIDGTEIRMMAPGTWFHQDIEGSIYRQFWTFFEGKPCRPFHEVGVDLFPELERGKKQKVIPDVGVLCDLSKINDKGVIEGAPDLVVEILSPSTSNYDMNEKMFKYKRAGVREYWLVDGSMEAPIKSNGDLIGATYPRLRTVGSRTLEGTADFLINQRFPRFIKWVFGEQYENGMYVELLGNVIESAIFPGLKVTL